MKIDIMQLSFIDKRLREMLVEVEEKTGVEFTVTSLFRIGDRGVHGQLPLRGVDLRIRNKAFAEEVVRFIDSIWFYDHSRPHLSCCKAHGEGSNFHLHFQVHPNTIRRFK